MLKALWNLLFSSKDMGVDLGTCNTLVYVRNEGVVLCEPSVVAINKRDGQIIADGNAVGERAKQMMGRTPLNAEVIRPMKDGVISNFHMAEAMLYYFIKKVHNYSENASPRVVIAVPSGATEVETRTVRNSAERAGARKVWVVSEPLAAALGVEMPIREPMGNMIVDIGGGTTEIAVISMMGIVHCQSLRVAGDKFDEAIMDYLKRRHNFVIGEATAERIKITIGSAMPPLSETDETSMEIRGCNLSKGGLPQSLMIDSKEIREALKNPLDQIVEAILKTLSNVPPELAGDICDAGIVLVGGGALLRDIDRLISRATKGIPVHIAEDPLTAVVRGTGILIQSIDSLVRQLDKQYAD